MRLLVISAIAISLVGIAPQIARAKQTYTLQQYPEGFANANVPCSAFKRTANGGWKEAAVFVYQGQRFTGNTYAAGSREAGIINQKCGPK
jgi:pectate lyase